jgi:hypothetical protein
VIVEYRLRDFRLIPHARRSFVHGQKGATGHRMLVASWLGLNLYWFGKELKQRVYSLLRKSADEIVTLDKLDARIDAEAHKKAEVWTRSYEEQTDRARDELSKAHKENSELYGENVLLRRAFDALRRETPS